MVKNGLYVTAVLAVAVITIMGCAAATPSSTDATAARPALDLAPAKLRLGTTGVVLPTLIVAQKQGFFTKENLTVEEQSLGSGTIAINALAAGQLDVIVPSPIPSILAIQKGVKAIIVSGLEYTFIDKTGKSWEANYVVVRDGEGIRQLTDLKGKKVAVSDVGSAYNYLLRAEMLADRIDPDKEMKILPVPYAQMPGALMQKLVDAVIVTADGYLQLQRMGQVAVIATHTSLAHLDLDLTSPIMVSADLAQKNPDVIVRFLRALIRARQWMVEDVSRTNGKNLTDLIRQAMNYSPELAQSLYETRAGYYGRELDYINLLDIPTRVVNRDFEILKVNGLLNADAPTTYEQVVDIRPLKRAYDTLGIQWDETKH